MKISYNWLQSFFKQKPRTRNFVSVRGRLPAPEKLAEVLTMHSFEAEGVEKKGDDWILDIDVLPNRAHDCLNHIGIAREIAAITSSKLKIPKYEIKDKTRQSTDKTQNFLKVEVQDKNLCPRYCARVITDIKVASSPKRLKERLEAIGQKSINNVVDATNYVMFEMGQPLHVFDMDKIGGSPRRGLPPQIIVRRAKKEEKITTLENEKYELDSDILVIADLKEPVAIAGIKGGKKAEITSGTKNIILEAANFNPQNIRRTSKKLGLRTESSMRFEQGFDINLASEAIDRLAVLIQEVAGGKITQGLIDIYPKKIKPQKINLEIEKVKRLLGIDISIKEIKKILERLGFVIQGLPLASTPGAAPERLEVVVPTWRMDITIPEDLVEEIGRLYGYEKIPAQLPSAVLIPPEQNESLFYENRIREILTGLGFTEVYNYSFVNEKQVSSFKFQVSRLVEVENPVSQEQKYLRPNLILNLLKNVKDNLRFFNEIRLFEIGKAFQRTENGKQRTIETKKLGLIFSLKDKHRDAQEFYYIKGIVDSFLNKLRISDVWYSDQISDFTRLPARQGFQILDLFHSGRRAEIKVGQETLGWLGEINPEILKELSIESQAAGFEIDFEKLVALATEEREYLPPSKYPAVIRDIAVLVEPNTKVEEVLNLIETAGGALVQDVDLFDIYEGEEIEQGKKNLAFHIIYQADDHTLTDKEVNEIHNKIILALEEEGGWEVRK